MSQTMKYSLDGGTTWHDAPEGVRVVYGDLSTEIMNVETPVELHINCTHEGLIRDVYAAAEDDSRCFGTDSQMASDIMDHLVEYGDRPEEVEEYETTSQAVDRLAKLIEELKLELHEVEFVFGIDHDRIGTGGAREVLATVMLEGDEPGWMEEALREAADRKKSR